MNFSKNLVILSFLSLVIISCNSDDTEQVQPEFSDIDPRLPSFGSSFGYPNYINSFQERILYKDVVEKDGGYFIEEKGVCFDTFPNPKIEISNFVSKGNSVGLIDAELSPLNPNTNYYVRAFASNSIGTSYGNQYRIRTQNKGEASGEFKGQAWVMYEYFLNENSNLIYLYCTLPQDTIEFIIYHPDRISDKVFPLCDTSLGRLRYELYSSGETDLIRDIGHIAITNNLNEKIDGSFDLADSLGIKGQFIGLSHFDQFQ